LNLKFEIWKKENFVGLKKKKKKMIWRYLYKKYSNARSGFRDCK